MKIVYIITGLNFSGAELMLYKICSVLYKKNDINVISLSTSGDVALKLKQRGITVFSLGLDRNILSTFYNLIKIYFILKKIKPDIVHTWMYHADLVGGIIAKLAGVKNVFWCIRNSNLSASLTKRSTLIVVWLCSKLSHIIPSRIVCCSKKAISVHIDKGYNKKKFYFIPNGFNTNKYKPSHTLRVYFKKENSISSSNRLIGVIGRYHPQKNHLGFLKCAYELIQNFNNISFIFVGKSLDINNYELVTKLKYYNLSNHFHLLGERRDIFKIMPALDILVSPSIYGEAFPNVIGEAMSCGVPCVVTDVGDSSLITGPFGFTVPAYDYRSLVMQISYILNLNRDDYYDLSNAARNRIKTEYDLDKISLKYQRLYDKFIV